MSKPPKNSTLLSNELNMAVGWEPSTVCCRNGIPFGAAYVSKYSFTLGFKTGSLFLFKGYGNEIHC